MLIVALAVSGRGLGIDLDHGRAAGQRKLGQAGRRVDDRRGPHHHHHVGGLGRLDRRLPRPLGQLFAEPHDVGPDQAAAARAHRRFDFQRRFGHLGQRLGVGQIATGTTEFEKAAVQVVHRRAAGALMQVVDILGDDGDLGIVLPRGDGAVAVVGFDGGHQVVAPQIPSPDPFGVVAPALGAGQLVRVEAGPQSVLVVAKCRHTALRGDPRAAEYRHSHPTKIAAGDTG